MTSQGPLNNILSTTSLTETLSRDYFLIIGRLSATQDGLRILDKTPGIFQHLMDICSMTFRDSLIKVCVIQLINSFVTSDCNLLSSEVSCFKLSIDKEIGLELIGSRLHSCLQLLNNQTRFLSQTVK